MKYLNIVCIIFKCLKIQLNSYFTTLKKHKTWVEYGFLEHLLSIGILCASRGYWFNLDATILEYFIHYYFLKSK